MSSVFVCLFVCLIILFLTGGPGVGEVGPELRTTVAPVQVGLIGFEKEEAVGLFAIAVAVIIITIIIFVVDYYLSEMYLHHELMVYYTQLLVDLQHYLLY